MLVTVKAREVQRALLAEMRGAREAAVRHFLAAAHLELVLAEDYQTAGESELSRRSQISAASCFWRGGETGRGRQILDRLERDDPSRSRSLQQILAELSRDYPAVTP
jgi:hypothetical protein